MQGHLHPDERHWQLVLSARPLALFCEQATEAVTLSDAFFLRNSAQALIEKIRAAETSRLPQLGAEKIEALVRKSFEEELARELFQSAKLVIKRELQFGQKFGNQIKSLHRNRWSWLDVSKRYSFLATYSIPSNRKVNYELDKMADVERKLDGFLLKMPVDVKLAFDEILPALERASSTNLLWVQSLRDVDKFADDKVRVKFTVAGFAIAVLSFVLGRLSSGQ